MAHDTHRSKHEPRTRGERHLRVAWVFVALIPVAFVGAMVLGEGLLSALGYSGEELVPFEVELKAAGPAILLMLLPTVGAVSFGLSARRQGVPTGWIPALVGGVVAAAEVAANVGSYVLGRLLG